MLVPMIIYMTLGSIVGVLAGLLGIGGGVILVPTLSIIFAYQKFAPEHIHLLTLGTSMASIIFTSISSMRSHHKRGGVRWDVWRALVPGIITGGFIGPALASRLPTVYLKSIFIVFIFYVIFQMIKNIKPKPSRQLPKTFGLLVVGLIIGTGSSLVAIGGGSISVPFLLWCNMAMPLAIGTAAAIGFPIALAGSVGYIMNGMQISGLPDFTLGYIYMPALIGLVSMSMLTAPIGARLAHTLPVPRLKKIFAALLLILGTRMLYRTFF